MYLPKKKKNYCFDDFHAHVRSVKSLEDSVLSVSPLANAERIRVHFCSNQKRWCETVRLLI